MIGNGRTDAAIQVTSVQSAVKHGVPAGVGLLVIDEAHHAAAPSYRKVMDLCPRARVLGLSATPARLDGQPLGDVFDDLIDGPTAEWLVQDGSLAQPRYFAPGREESAAMVEGVRVADGDYSRRDLAARVNSRALVGDIVSHWQTHAAGIQTIVFAVSVSHAEAIARRFVAVGVKARALSGATPTAERRTAMDAFRRGDLRMIVNCELFGEGLDVPEVRCVVLARPTQSLTVFRQQCGRAMRPGEGSPVILDHAGNVWRHGLPTRHVPWSLDECVEREKGGPAVCRCGVCGYVGAREGGACVNCGATIPKAERLDPEENDRARLIELAATNGVNANAYRGRLNGGWSPEDAATVPMKRCRWDEWRETAEKHGVNQALFNTRMNKRNGWPAERAASTPPRDSRWATWMALCQQHGVTKAMFYQRTGHLGMPPEAAATATLDGRRRSITLDGVTYESAGHAASVLGVSLRTVLSREALAHGLCKDCRKVPVATGKKKCHSCNDRGLANERARRSLALGTPARAGKGA
jgi:hypothetical protein